jgi:hypothetical protein
MSRSLDGSVRVDTSSIPINSHHSVPYGDDVRAWGKREKKEREIEKN